MHKTIKVNGKNAYQVHFFRKMAGIVGLKLCTYYMYIFSNHSWVIKTNYVVFSCIGDTFMKYKFLIYKGFSNFIIFKRGVHKLRLQEEGGRWSKKSTFCKLLYHRKCKRRG